MPSPFLHARTDDNGIVCIRNDAYYVASNDSRSHTWDKLLRKCPAEP